MLADNENIFEITSTYGVVLLIVATSQQRALRRYIDTHAKHGKIAGASDLFTITGPERTSVWGAVGRLAEAGSRTVH